MVRVTQDRTGKSKFRGVTLCGRGATSRVSSVRNLRLLCEFASGSKSWYVGQMERTEIGGNDHPEQTPEIQAFTQQPMLPSKAFDPKYNSEPIFFSEFKI